MHYVQQLELDLLEVLPASAALDTEDPTLQGSPCRKQKAEMGWLLVVRPSNFHRLRVLARVCPGLLTVSGP